MPVSCRIDPASRTAEVNLSGIVTRDDFVQAMETCYRHPKWQAGFTALWDAREIRQLILSPADVEAIVASMAALEPFMGEGRTAFVVPRDIDSLVARLLIRRGEGSKRERRTFTDLASAQAWLHGENDARRTGS